MQERGYTFSSHKNQDGIKMDITISAESIWLCPSC